MTTCPTGDHYAVKITDLPPTEAVCCCGAVFDRGDVLAALKAHIDQAGE